MPKVSKTPLGSPQSVQKAADRSGSGVRDLDCRDAILLISAFSAPEMQSVCQCAV